MIIIWSLFTVLWGFSVTTALLGLTKQDKNWNWIFGWFVVAIIANAGQWILTYLINKHL